MFLIDLIITAYISFWTPIMNLLPDYSGMPVDIVSAFNFFTPYVIAGSQFYPLLSALAILALMLFIQSSIFAYRVIIWTINKIPVFGQIK